MSDSSNTPDPKPKETPATHHNPSDAIRASDEVPVVLPGGTNATDPTERAADDGMSPPVGVTSDLRAYFAARPTSERVKTDYLNLPQPVSGEIVHRPPSPGTVRLTSAWKLRWRIAEETILMALEDRSVVGRSMDGDTSIGFDLTPFGAYHLGVSRMHAILTMNDGFLYLEDLNSTNGTRINGFQVTPKQKYRLRDGDEIEFARLRTVVKFETPK